MVDRDIRPPLASVKGKVAFITGGSSGIGLGIARAFLEAEMNVVIGYRTKRHLEAAMPYLNAPASAVHAVSVDVTDRTGMEAAGAETVETFGKVHVLVNNAGVQLFKPLSATSYEDWDWLMSVNVDGVFNGLHAFLPHIREHGEGGQIITTSSVLGLFAASHLGCYTTSKFALVGMMEALRGELACANIGVSLYCPGLVDSRLDESDRNRPARVVGADPQQNFPTDLPHQQRNVDPASLMDPLEAGRLVLRGMVNNDLYILTHPEFEQIMRARSEALIASIPAGRRPNATRLEIGRSVLQNSIYASGRYRQT